MIDLIWTVPQGDRNCTQQPMGEGTRRAPLSAMPCPACASAERVLLACSRGSAILAGAVEGCAEEECDCHRPERIGRRALHGTLREFRRWTLTPTCPFTICQSPAPVPSQAPLQRVISATPGECTAGLCRPAPDMHTTEPRRLNTVICASGSASSSHTPVPYGTHSSRTD